MALHVYHLDPDQVAAVKTIADRGHSTSHWRATVTVL